MRTDSEALDAVPHAAIVMALAVSLVWVAVAVALIAPHNQVKGIVRTAPLPIDSLPKRPVMQLALARSQADIDAVLDVARDPRRLNVAEVRAGNVLDTLVLVPGYTLLLIALSLLVARSSRLRVVDVRPALSDRPGTWLFGVGVVLAVALAIADLAENGAIAYALAAAQRGDAMTSLARRAMVGAALSKWTLLGTIALFFGVVMAAQEHVWRRRLSPLLLAAGVYTLAPILRHVVARWFSW